MRGSIAEESLHLCWTTNAASCVGAEAEVKPGVGSYAGARAGRGGRRVLVAVAAGVEGGVVVYPVCGGGFSVGELAGFHFTDDDGAGVDKALDRDGVGGGWWVEVVPCSIAVAGLDTGNVEDVFYS